MAFLIYLEEMIEILPPMLFRELDKYWQTDVYQENLGAALIRIVARDLARQNGIVMGVSMILKDPSQTDPGVWQAGFWP